MTFKMQSSEDFAIQTKGGGKIIVPNVVTEPQFNPTAAYAVDAKVWYGNVQYVCTKATTKPAEEQSNPTPEEDTAHWSALPVEEMAKKSEVAGKVSSVSVDNTTLTPDANGNVALPVTNSTTLSSGNVLASAKAVKTVNDKLSNKADKPATFTEGNLAALDSNGNPTDSGIAATSKSTGKDFAIGKGATTTGANGALAVGANAGAGGNKSTAIGLNAKANAAESMQLGGGTNTVPQSLKFRDTTVVDGNGKIPSANLDVKVAEKSDVYPLLFAQYYPDGSVKSAAEFTSEIKYNEPDTTARTITVKPFCNIDGTAENDNSNLVGSVVIPPFVDKQGNPYINDDGTRFKVVGISGGSPATANDNLTTIITPTTVTYIGESAFDSCISLTTASIPAAESIESYVFYHCTKLVSVSIPAAKSIGIGVFDSCDKLIAVSIAVAESIGESAFNGCTLTSVDFGNTPRSSVPTLGNNAFYGVPKACKIIVPDAQYDAWTAETLPDESPNPWYALMTAGYKFLKHSEWEYARRYETMLTPTCSDTPAFSKWVVGGGPSADYWMRLDSDGWNIYVTTEDYPEGLKLTNTGKGDTLSTSLSWTRQEAFTSFTATRTRTDIIGYTLGEQTDKPVLGFGRRVFFATSETAANQTTKTATVDGDGFSLYRGCIVVVESTYGNSQPSATIDINGTGAKTVRRFWGQDYPSVGQWGSGELLPLMYDGSGWTILRPARATTGTPGVVQLAGSLDAPGMGDTSAPTPNAVNAALNGKLDKNRRVFYATCSTASNTPEKSATVADGLGAFALASGVVVIVKFDNSNKNGSPTLNVGGTGAKSIKHYGNTDALSGAWQNGEAVEFVYDGTNWMLMKAVKADSERFGTVKISDATNGSASDVAVSQKAMHDANDTKLNKTDVVAPSSTATTGQAADAKATGDTLEPFLFAQYYPEGNVKSAAEFTQGIKYDDPDTTNRTITVKPFCYTDNPEGDNSDLAGRVVIPPFVDARGNPYISDDGTRYKVVGVSGGDSAGGGGILTAIIAPNTVKTLGDNAFSLCLLLTSVSIPAATDLGSAFFDCDALSAVSLPSATTIGAAALNHCAVLTYVSLPAVTSIGESAFADCDKLAYVDFGDTPRSSVPSLGEDAFDGVLTTCRIIVPDAQYDAWTAASGWSNLVTRDYKFLRHSEWEYARKYEVDKKADKPATFTTGNLAKFDSSGNPTDSGKKPSDFQSALSAQQLANIDAVPDKRDKLDLNVYEKVPAGWAFTALPEGSVNPYSQLFPEWDSSIGKWNLYDGGTFVGMSGASTQEATDIVFMLMNYPQIRIHAMYSEGGITQTSDTLVKKSDVVVRFPVYNGQNQQYFDDSATDEDDPTKTYKDTGTHRWTATKRCIAYFNMQGSSSQSTVRIVVNDKSEVDSTTVFTHTVYRNLNFANRCACVPLFLNANDKVYVKITDNALTSLTISVFYI